MRIGRFHDMRLSVIGSYREKDSSFHPGFENLGEGNTVIYKQISQIRLSIGT